MNNEKKQVLELRMDLIYFGKKHFLKNSICFGIYADFNVDNEVDNSSIGNKATNIYKPNPICNC